MTNVLAIIAVVAGIFHATSAQADLAANTQILNQATLSYDDGTSTLTLTDSVLVTVALVSGVPTLSSPADDATPYAGAATQIPFTYTLTAGSNGPDTYTLATSIPSQTNTATATAAAPGSVLLGASITTSGSTAGIINVPSDGATDGNVNGIAVNDTVSVNGESRTVTAISDPATGVATLTLSSVLSSAPAIGVPVLEQQTFTMTVTSGTIIASGTDIVVTARTTASTTAGSATDDVDATFTSGTASLVKYVRNVDFAAGNPSSGGINFTVNGSANDYFTSGVTGRSNDTLEYLLVINNSSTGSVSDCFVTDTIPTSFVTFKPDVYGPGTVDEIIYIDTTGTENYLTEGSGDDQATLAGSTLTVYLGTGSGPAFGGTIANGDGVRVAFQVTINP